MKIIVVILVIVGISLSLSAIEIEDTFDEWDMIIEGCIEFMKDNSSIGMEGVRIIRKVDRGIELTCQEKVILVLETQKYIREIVEFMETSKVLPKELPKDKRAAAWSVVKYDRRLEELTSIEGVRTRKEKAEYRVYYIKLTKALKLFFPECFTDK
jgi:hypothetical protein